MVWTAGTLSAHAACASDTDLSQLDLATLMEMDVTMVTAQKRVEDAGTVPISMTVLRATDIAHARLDSTFDLQAVAPGLTTSGNLGLMLPHVRGVGNNINSSGIDPSVSVYVDGVYQAERAQTWSDLADVEQIEILKGPQGALYGRNATGGVINIKTRGPSDHLEATVGLTAGNLDLRDASFFLAGPLNERLRVSLAAHVREQDSFYTHVLGTHELKSEDFYTLHGRLQATLTPALEAELLLKYLSRDDSVNDATEMSGHSIPALLGATVATGPYETSWNMDDPAQRVDSTTTALKLNWRTPLVQLRSIGAYNQQRHEIAVDFDNSDMTLREMRAVEPSHIFTQELQISPADATGHIDWLVGAFYVNGTTGFAPVTFDTTLPLVGPIRQLLFGDVETEAYSAFGEVTWALDKALSLTAGIRYSNEDKALTNASLVLPGASIVFPDRSERWDNVSYRTVAKFVRDRSMLYAKIETGFKSGTYNNANPIDPGPIDPEKITAYEVGFKHSLANAPLRLAAAAFFNDYRDLQIQIVDTNTGITLLEQAPKAAAYGLDFETVYKLGEHWSFASGLAWLNAEYREFVSNGVLVPDPAGGHTAPASLDLAGNRLPRSPEFTGRITAAFDYPMATGAIFGSANYYRTSRVYFEPSNNYSQAGFGLLNAQVGYRSKAHWSLSAWAKNLMDQAYLNAIVPGQLSAFGQYAEPRTYGVTLGFSFGQ